MPDVAIAYALLHGDEDSVHGDAGYQICPQAFLYAKRHFGYTNVHCPGSAKKRSASRCFWVSRTC